MKRLISNYTFNVQAGSISLNDFDYIELERVLIVTNVTQNDVMYLFNEPTLGGHVLGNTLVFNKVMLGGYSDTDEMQVYYDDPSSEQLADIMYEMVQRLGLLSQVQGIQGDLRTTVINTVPTTISGGTITTLSNIAAVGGYNTNSTVQTQTNLTAIQSNINNVVIS